MKPSPPKTPRRSRANISKNKKENETQENDEVQTENDQNDINLDDDNLASFVAQRSFRGHTIKIDQFGTSTPSWTIGSSRREPRPKEDMPSPTEYDISNYNTISSIAYKNQNKRNTNLTRPSTTRNLNKNSFSRNLSSTSRSNYIDSRSPRTIKSDQNDILKNNRTITSDIDYFNANDYYSTFGNLKRSRSIGVRKDTVFWTPTQSPPAMYELNTSLSPRNIRIGKRIPEKIDDKPGPGQYTPSTEYTSIDNNKKLLTISKSSERDVFHIDKNGSPGPGEYEVIKRPRKAPTWFKERRVTKPAYERDGSSYASSRVSFR